MSNTYLRLYRAPKDENLTDDRFAGQEQIGDALVERTVTMNVSQVLPLLADAVLSDRAWLRDFAFDQVTLSADLYEVLMAYKHLRKPSA